MARPRTEPIEVRRKEILNAAKSVLIEKGYQVLRLDDVAHRAKVAKGTIYLYFKNKEQLFLAVMQDVIHNWEGKRRQIPPSASAMETLRHTTEAMLTSYLENRDFLSTLSLQRPHLCGVAAGKAMRKEFSNHIQGLSGILKAGIKEGQLRAHDTNQGGRFLVTMVRFFALFEIPENPGKPLSQHVQSLLALYLHGLGREKGTSKGQTR